MSQREVDINLSDTNKLVLEPTHEDEIAFRERVSVVLDRGLIIDRLAVPGLPANLYGEWISTDPVTQASASLKGFVDGSEYAAKTGLNDDGTGAIKNVDVKFMVMPKWQKKIIDEVNAKRYEQNHLSDKRKQKEERDFEANNKAIGIPVETKNKSLVASETTNVSGDQIEQALKAK